MVNTGGEIEVPGSDRDRCSICSLVTHTSFTSLGFPLNPRHLDRHSIWHRYDGLPASPQKEGQGATSKMHPISLVLETPSELTISARAEMTFPSVVKDLLMLAPSCVWRRQSGHQEASGASCSSVIPWGLTPCDTQLRPPSPDC